MALTCRSTAAALNTSTGTQDITIASMGNPGDSKCLLLATLVAATSGGSSAHANMSIGMTDGTREFCMSGESRDNVSTTSCARHAKATLGFLGTIGGVGTDCEFTFDSWITDGVRISVDTAPSSAYMVLFTFIFGTDIANVYVGEHDDLGTSAGTTNITAPGFAADMAFIMSPGANTPADLTNTSDMMFSFGCWIDDGSDTQYCASYADDTGRGTSEVNGFAANDKAWCRVNRNSNTAEGTVAQHANGISVTTTGSTHNGQVLYYGLIEWGTAPDIDLVSVEMPSTAIDYVESGLSFEPEFALLNISGANTAYGTVDATGPNFYTVAALESGQVETVGCGADDSVSTSDTSSFHRSLLHAEEADGSVFYSGGLDSIDSNGWTIDLTGGTTSSAVRRGWALAIAASGGGSAALTGTLSDNATEAEIVSGEQTLIITLTDDTWIS